MSSTIMEKGLTLRKKGNRRAQQQSSGPKEISSPVSLAKEPLKPGGSGSNVLAVPHEQRNKGGDDTSDFVKRRYSTRFAAPPDFSSGAPPIPGVPSIPSRFADQGARPGSRERPRSGGTQPVRVDLQALKDPALQADKYVADLLSNASEQDIRDYQISLRKIKNRASTDMVQHVYQNRTQFIKIAKEAEKLKGEMRTLRTLLSELTSALGQASVSNGSSRSPTHDERSSNRRNANRSSLANLEAMYTTQLHSLWKNVERSQKFLPAIPGRHIIVETGHWVELDSATWKPRRPVHIIILNDHLMIASKKRKRVDQNDAQQMKGPPPTKLVAEECWPIQDIDLIDLGANLATAGANAPTADERSINSAVNIRYGNKSFTYRHERGDSKEKSNLLATFRKTVEDLRKSLRTDVETTPRATSDPRSAALDALTGASSQPTAASSGRPLSFLIEVDGKQQNLRWVESQIDELDIEISLHRFESAVSSIERLRKLAKSLRNNPIPQNLINSKASDRVVTLSTVLCRLLGDTSASVTATKDYTSWLSRLNLDNLARESYLSSRSTLLTARATQTTFTGPLPIYIFQLTHVYFTLIKNTITTYQQCFAPAQMSSMVKWAKEQLEAYNVVLVRQMGNVEIGGETWGECVAIVRDGLTSLKEVGVDFGGLVGKGIQGWEEVEAVDGSKGGR